MNSQFLLKPIPMSRILEIANCHFQDIMPIVDKNANNSVILTVPATTTSDFVIDSIGNWDLLVTHIVGTYTTVKNSAGSPIDDGVSRLLFNIGLSGWNRDLSRVLFPVEQFFTPGRVRHPDGTNNTGANQCAASNSLLVPKPCPILLLKSQGVTVQLKNTADFAQKVTMSLMGWRVTMKEHALQRILDSLDHRTASESAGAGGRGSPVAMSN